MTQPRHRTHREVIEETLDLAGARVADIGCGDGSLVRLMTRLGAQVTGIDPSEGQLARARSAERVGHEEYLTGVAERLPFPNASLDIAVLFNALHHVPVEQQNAALAEAARTLKPDGLLAVVEPIAEGPHFRVGRRIEDETHVRAKAYEALEAAAAGPNFSQERELIYVTEIRYPNFEAYRSRMIAVDESRRPRVETQEAALRQDFEATAKKRDDVYLLEQPARLNLLRRR